MLECKCGSKDQNLYGAKMLYMLSQLHGVVSIEMDFQIRVSMQVPITMFLIITTFLLVMMIAKFLDMANEQKVRYYLVVVTLRLPEPSSHKPGALLFSELNRWNLEVEI